MGYGDLLFLNQRGLNNAPVSGRNQAASGGNPSPTQAPGPQPATPSGPPAGWQGSRGMLEIPQFGNQTPTGGGGGGGGGVSVSSAPPPPPAPLLPKFNPISTVNKNFKVAPSDIIQFDEDSVEIELISDLLFEDIGGVELADIVRSDLIDGQPTIYSPIKNLSIVRREFNPNNIVATSFNADYFSRFGINIISAGIYEPYFNEEGDMVIEVDSIADNEEIQVEIVTNGTISQIGN